MSIGLMFDAVRGGGLGSGLIFPVRRGPYGGTPTLTVPQRHSHTPTFPTASNHPSTAFTVPCNRCATALELLPSPSSKSLPPKAPAPIQASPWLGGGGGGMAPLHREMGDLNRALNKSFPWQVGLQKAGHFKGRRAVQRITTLWERHQQQQPYGPRQRIASPGKPGKGAPHIPRLPGGRRAGHTPPRAVAIVSQTCWSSACRIGPEEGDGGTGREERGAALCTLSMAGGPWRIDGGGGGVAAQGHGAGLFAFGGAYWPLAIAQGGAAIRGGGRTPTTTSTTLNTPIIGRR